MQPIRIQRMSSLSMSASIRRLFILLPVVLLVTGCSAVTGEEPPVAMLPTLTPSPVLTLTPAIGSDGGQPADPNQPLTPTITLSPVPPTAALGPTTTVDPAAIPTVNPNQPVIAGPNIVYFVATPDEAREGEPVMLIWSTEGAADAAVYRLNEDGTPGQTWAVEVEGSLSVVPRDGFASESFVLAVTNGISTVEQTLTFDVQCGKVWFFLPDPDDLCPIDDPVQSDAALQEFEQGRMFRLGSTNEVIMLFDDFPTVAGTQNPAWLRIPDPYSEGLPVEDPAIEAPSGLLEPERGFGQVWRDTPGVRDRLGWATGPEQPYTTTYQSAPTPLGEQIFFTDTLDQVITLVPEQRGWLVAGFAD